MYNRNRNKDRYLFGKVPDNDLPLEALLKKYILQNERRWEENERRWEENERRWEGNERRWEENERRWKENSQRWERNFKLLGVMIRKIDGIDKRLARIETHFK